MPLLEISEDLVLLLLQVLGPILRSWPGPGPVSPPSLLEFYSKLTATMPMTLTPVHGPYLLSPSASPSPGTPVRMHSVSPHSPPVSPPLDRTPLPDLPGFDTPPEQPPSQSDSHNSGKRRSDSLGNEEDSASHSEHPSKKARSHTVPPDDADGDDDGDGNNGGPAVAAAKKKSCPRNATRARRRRKGRRPGLRSGARGAINVGGAPLPLGPLQHDGREDEFDEDEEEDGDEHLLDDPNYQDNQENLVQTQPSGHARFRRSGGSKKCVTWCKNGPPPSLSSTASRLICALAALETELSQRKITELLLALHHPLSSEASSCSEMALPALVQRYLRFEQTACLTSFQIMVTLMQITIRIDEYVLGSFCIIPFFWLIHILTQVEEICETPPIN